MTQTSIKRTDNFARSRQFSVFVLLVTLVMVLVSGCSLRLEGERTLSAIGEDTVAAGQKIENDILLTGTNVIVDGEINGDLLAIGNTVTINGPISGSVVAFGQKVVINGEIGGSLYSIGQTLVLGPSSIISNNAHFVGLLLDTLSGSIVQRDLVVLTLRGRLNSEIGRSLNGFILLMTFSGRIGAMPGNQTIQENAPAPTDESPVEEPGARLFGNKRVFIGATGADLANSPAPPRFIRQRNASPVINSEQKSDLANALPEWLFDRLTELAILLPFGLVVLWLFPLAVKKPAKGLRGRPLSSIGFGLLGVVVAVNIVAIMTFLLTLLMMFGIWLGSVFTWDLSFIVWGVGFPALMLAFALFILAVLFGGKVILADLVGTLIFKKLAPKANSYRILPFLLGVTLYILLRAIPTFGLFLEITVTILGLGAIWVAINEQRQITRQKAAKELIVENPTE